MRLNEGDGVQVQCTYSVSKLEDIPTADCDEYPILHL